jgi:hypothetical protein
MRRSRRTRLLRLGLVTGLAFLGRTALGCGFEDPGSATVQRGVLNLAYTNSLHVIGAVTQATMEGILESNARPITSWISKSMMARPRSCSESSL